MGEGGVGKADEIVGSLEAEQGAARLVGRSAGRNGEVSRQMGMEMSRTCAHFNLFPTADPGIINANSHAHVDLYPPGVRIYYGRGHLGSDTQLIGLVSGWESSVI